MFYLITLVKGGRGRNLNSLIYVPSRTRILKIKKASNLGSFFYEGRLRNFIAWFRAAIWRNNENTFTISSSKYHSV